MKNLSKKCKLLLLDAKLYGIIFDFCGGLVLLMCGTLVVSGTIKYHGLGSFLIIVAILCLIARFFYMMDILWARDYHPLIPRLELAKIRLAHESEYTLNDSTSNNSTLDNRTLDNTISNESSDLSLALEMAN